MRKCNERAVHANRGTNDTLRFELPAVRRVMTWRPANHRASTAPTSFVRTKRRDQAWIRMLS
jgi:hypothetical protein